VDELVGSLKADSLSAPMSRTDSSVAAQRSGEGGSAAGCLLLALTRARGFSRSRQCFDHIVVANSVLLGERSSLIGCGVPGGAPCGERES
jgi:hypothetical protein